MRKLTVVVFALFISVSAIAAPNDSSDRRTPGLITRIVRQIKSIFHPFDDPQSIPPQPNVANP
jgi:hypothetical protein